MINLASRTDRWTAMQRAIAAHADWLRLHRIDAICDPVAPWKGCYRSHQCVWEQLDRTGGASLVLEDDVELSPVARPLLNDVMSRMPSDWDVLLLSCTGADVKRRVSPRIYRVGRFCGTYGMLINGSSVDKIIARVTPAPTQPIDDELSALSERNRLNVYLAHPFLISLVDSPSDISGTDCFTNYKCAVDTMDLILSELA